MSERSILSRLVTSAKGEPENAGVPAAQQFPKGYAGGQLPGAYGTNFAQFRPQYSVPGQQVRDWYTYIPSVCHFLFSKQYFPLIRDPDSFL